VQNFFLEVELSSILTAEAASVTPFRILTLLIFAAAVIHTLMANHFTSLSEKVAGRHAKKMKTKPHYKQVSFLAEVLHFFGEIEVVFALWVVPLMFVVTIFYGWDDTIQYLNSRVYIEPLFIVVMMSLAATRPIIKLAEKGVHAIAKFFGDTKAVWWLTILTLGPLLGSVITEVAAITIAAVLLKEKLFIYGPSKRLAYGTLGLMFVHFSVGGTLTNFAAPPALTLSRCWEWDVFDFLSQFGWQVLFGIFFLNVIYFLYYQKDFKQLKKVKHKEEKSLEADEHKGPVPLWVTLCHLVFLVWIIMMAEYPPLFLGGYLVFLGFHQATRYHQYVLNLKRPMMVGLFLAGLVIHGGFQGWWIEPLLGDLGYGAMMLVGTVLTAFNENTTVAHLACLLSDLSPRLQYAIASGLVAGGGLTIIAHAPNPVGQSLVRKYFRHGISPWSLFLSALIPTVVFLGIFYFFPSVKV